MDKTMLKTGTAYRFYEDLRSKNNEMKLSTAKDRQQKKGSN